MALENVRDLDLVFGPESAGKTARERAQTSTRLFVRSQVQLAEDSPEAKGHRLSAWEALQTFGLPKLLKFSSTVVQFCPALLMKPPKTAQ